MSLSSLSLFSYETAHELLAAAYKSKLSVNPTFSMRAWARKLGLASNATLSLMLSGKRSIPRKYIPIFVSELGLSSQEAIYFESLVELQKARGSRARSFYLERAQILRPKNAPSFVELESLRTLSHPLHMALLEMCELRNFSPDSKTIRKRLREPVSVRDIEDMIERLIGLGLLKESKTGQLQKTHKAISTRPDVVDAGSREYHRKVAMLAAVAIDEQALDEREFNGYAINVQRSALPKAKKLIRRFIEEFSGEVEADPGDGEETYQLNLQFFSLTKNQNPKETI